MVQLKGFLPLVFSCLANPEKFAKKKQQIKKEKNRYIIVPAVHLTSKIKDNFLKRYGR